jgi:hypothetical protein
MKRLHRRSHRALAAASLLGALALVGGFAGAAAGGSPASGRVKAVTHTSNHSDTCNCGSNVSSANGPVWAYDNLSRQLTATLNSDGTYTVVVVDHGSFAAFAEPNNADHVTFFPIAANGSIDGTITYIVTSSQGPDASLLPSQVPSDQGTRATVLELFPSSGTPSVTGGGDYTYVYRAGGETYTQTTAGITGDITGH